MTSMPLPSPDALSMLRMGIEMIEEWINYHASADSIERLDEDVATEMAAATQQANEWLRQMETQT